MVAVTGSVMVIFGVVFLLLFIYFALLLLRLRLLFSLTGSRRMVVVGMSVVLQLFSGQIAVARLFIHLWRLVRQQDALRLGGVVVVVVVDDAVGELLHQLPVHLDRHGSRVMDSGDFVVCRWVYLVLGVYVIVQRHGLLATGGSGLRGQLGDASVGGSLYNPHLSLQSSHGPKPNAPTHTQKSRRYTIFYIYPTPSIPGST